MFKTMSSGYTHLKYSLSSVLHFYKGYFYNSYFCTKDDMTRHRIVKPRPQSSLFTLSALLEEAVRLW